MRARGVPAASPAAAVSRRAHAGARRDRPGGDPPVPHRVPRPARRDGAAHVALHAGRDRARVASADDQPRPPTVRRGARCPGGADRAHQADRAGARRRRRRRPSRHRGGAGRVRRTEELPLSERGARGAARGRACDERPPAGRIPRSRSVDRRSADRGSDPARVRARRGGGPVIRRYAALIRNAWLVDLQYRAAIVLWLLWGVTEPAIALGIWWAIALVAVLLAAGMRFFISFTTGLLAFWTTRATAVMELHAGVSLFLAGRIAPLALLPPAVAAVAGALWFRSMLAFPVDLLTGAVHGADAIVRGLASQVVWLGIWIVAYRIASSRGIRKYGAVGG